MNKVIFRNKVEHEIESARRINKHTIKLYGENVPLNTSGFSIVPEYTERSIDFSGFTTVYRVENDGVTYSDDESVYSQDTTISVKWDDSDDYDGIRPTEIEVTVLRDGEEAETVVLSDENEWKYVVTDTVSIPSYSVESDDVQGYEKTVSGTSIRFYHQADIPVPPTPPSIEERVEKLEEDMPKRYSKRAYIGDTTARFAYSDGVVQASVINELGESVPCSVSLDNDIVVTFDELQSVATVTISIS